MRVSAACLAAATLALSAILSSCGAGPPHDFPASAQAQFSASCPQSDPVCACTWDKITREMTYEQYQSALQRFRSDGLMDHHITHARTVCVEQNPHRPT